MSQEVWNIRVQFGDSVQAVRVRRDSEGTVTAYLAGPPEGWTVDELRAVADEMEKHERTKVAEALQAGNVYIDCNYMLWVCEEAAGGGLVLRDPYGLRPALKIGDSQDLAKYMRLVWTIQEAREWEAETSAPVERRAV